MKLYTLNYDCNRPMLQQINVPTNTDYKVGIKIYKDGKQMSPLASSVTLGGLSADTDKTNGYITFSKAAGDTASVVQETVDIDEGYEKATEQLSSLGYNSTGANITIRVQNPISVDVPEELYGTEVELSSAQIYLASESADVGFDDSKWTYIKDRMLSQGYVTNVAIVTIDGKQYYAALPNETAWSSSMTNQYYDLVKDFPLNGAALYFDVNTNMWAFTLPKLVLNKGDILFICAQGSWKKNTYGYVGIKFNNGNPLKAKFKLTENTYKSQLGDLGVADPLKTVNFAGQFADGTDFNYEVAVK